MKDKYVSNFLFVHPRITKSQKGLLDRSDLVGVKKDLRFLMIVIGLRVTEQRFIKEDANSRTDGKMG